MDMREKLLDYNSEFTLDDRHDAEVQISELVIYKQKMEELLKTHCIVPNEPTESMLDVVRRDYDGPGYCFTETYKAMLEATQENNQ